MDENDTQMKKRSSIHPWGGFGYRTYYMHTYSGRWPNIISSTAPLFSFTQSHPPWMLNDTCSSIHLWGGCGYRAHTFTCVLIAGDDQHHIIHHPSMSMHTSQSHPHTLIQRGYWTRRRWYGWMSSYPLKCFHITMPWCMPSIPLDMVSNLAVFLTNPNQTNMSVPPTGGAPTLNLCIHVREPPI